MQSVRARGVSLAGSKRQTGKMVPANQERGETPLFLHKITTNRRKAHKKIAMIIMKNIQN